MGVQLEVVAPLVDPARDRGDLASPYVAASYGVRKNVPFTPRDSMRSMILSMPNGSEVPVHPAPDLVGWPAPDPGLDVHGDEHVGHVPSRPTPLMRRPSSTAP